MLKTDNKGKESSSTDSFILDEDESFNQIDEEEHLPMKENLSTLNREKLLVNFNSKVVYQKCFEEKKFGEKHHLTYKFIKFETKLIKKILDGHGFEQLHPSSPLFNLMWTSSSIKNSTYQTLLPFQRVNHFPKSSELTRKDRLYQNIQKMQQDKGFKHFDFIPTTFVLPKQFNQFQTTFEREKGIWIVKPIASSQGRGIFLINSISNVPRDANIVVSRYISNPLLIDGYKFDVRIYVAVTSYDPLVIYLYQEGLTRFATIKYDRNIDNLTNNFMHLTNYSVNKENTRYIRCDDPGIEDYGNKWTMSAMLRLLNSEGKDTFTLMMCIEDLIIKTFLSVQNQISNACQLFVPHKSNCFEIYGFDILIDDQLKPWLIEVNLSPSLNCDAPIDLKVKSGLICDLFNLILIPPLNIYQYLNEQKQYELVLNCIQTNLKLNENENKLKMEEIMLMKRIEEENNHCGCFIRIFPCEEMFEYFQNYFSEDKIHFHQILHQYFYPNRSKKSSLIHHRNHLQRYKYLSTIYHLSLKNSSIVRNSSQLSNAIQRFHCYHKTSLQVLCDREESLMNLLTCSSYDQISKKLIRMNSSSTDRLHLCKDFGEKENRYRVSSAPRDEHQRKFSRKSPFERSSRAITKRSSRFLSSSFSNEKSNNDEDFVDQLNELSSKQHRRQYSGSINIFKEIESKPPKSAHRLINLPKEEEKEILLEKTNEILHKNRMNKTQLAKQAKLFQEKLRRNEICSALNRYSHVPRLSKKTQISVNINVSVIHHQDRRKSAK